MLAVSKDNRGTPREDFALLEVAQPTGIAGLALPASVERLNPVTAAGFPGTLVQADLGFVKLLKGDASSMPEMVVTQGIVTVIQPNNGAPLVFHTATLTGGNSGGPLADACGRVVGINTFTRTDSDRPISFNGALGGAGIAAFLEAGNAGFTKVTGACESGGAPTAPPAATAGSK